MSSLVDQVAEAIKSAMKARDQTALAALRALKTALTNASIEKAGLGTPLDDSESLACVRKQIKQRADSADGFRKGGREDLALQEEAESRILEKYLPQPLTEAEVEAMVDAAIAETGATSKSQMGVVMKAVTALAVGRADGRTLSSAVGRRLV